MILGEDEKLWGDLEEAKHGRFNLRNVVVATYHVPFSIELFLIDTLISYGDSGILSHAIIHKIRRDG